MKLSDRLNKIPTLVRWILVLPGSMLASYLTGWLIHFVFDHDNSLAYLGAFISGVAYVLVGVIVARALAPSFKILVCGLLGVFIIGDLVTTYLFFTNGVFSDANPQDLSDLTPMFEMLRTNDFEALKYGQLTRVIGVVAGGMLIVFGLLRKRQ